MEGGREGERKEGEEMREGGRERGRGKSGSK